METPHTNVLSLVASFLVLGALFLVKKVAGGSDFRLEWVMFSGSELEWSMAFVSDWFSTLFIFLVSAVGVMVAIYSKSYMKGDPTKSKLFQGLVIFISSMFLLSTSDNLLAVMLGWDGLGLTSFFLVSYYRSTKSFNGAMITFVVNRIGDIFLILAISGCMSANTLSPWLSTESSMWMLSLVVVLGAMTKSAQVPFSAWLPRAMAAPTPVSSLVHSSTLVTAGVFLTIKFNLAVVSTEVSVILKYAAVLTVILAGISAFYSTDLKELIAYSTMSHIGFMMYFVSLGVVSGAMAHLFMHAFFKSILFMAAGKVIHESGGSQDIRSLSSSPVIQPSSVWILTVSVSSMAGIPFFTGFISKEFLGKALSFSGMTMVDSLLFLISVFTTCLYSVRVVVQINPNSGKILQESGEWKGLLFSGLLLIFIGSVMEWVFFLEMKVGEMGFAWIQFLIVWSFILASFLGISGQKSSFSKVKSWGKSSFFMPLSYFVLQEKVNNTSIILKQVDSTGWLSFLERELSKFPGQLEVVLVVIRKTWFSSLLVVLIVFLL